MSPSQHFRMTSLIVLLLSLMMMIMMRLTVCSQSSEVIDPGTTLECHRRQYRYPVSRADSLGRKCWDTITVMSCWGRCDSDEVADWQFPFKISHHPVCIHDKRKLRRKELRFCDPDVEIGTSIYEYYEAITCTCRTCQSSFANCEGVQ